MLDKKLLLDQPIYASTDHRNYQQETNYATMIHKKCKVIFFTRHVKSFGDHISTYYQIGDYTVNTLIFNRFILQCKGKMTKESNKSIIIIRNMETGGATSSLRILSPTAIIELGSIWRIVRSQFIVPYNPCHKKQ